MTAAAVPAGWTFDRNNPFRPAPGRFALGALSQKRMDGVHPDMRAVVGLAIILSGQDFLVVEGVRSDEQCFINYGKGRNVAKTRAGGVPSPERYAKPGLPKVTFLSKALNSNHRKKADGFGHAVDLAPYPVDWEGPVHFPKFNSIAAAMKTAAQMLDVDMTWGGDWPRNKDRPHFELG